MSTGIEAAEPAAVPSHSPSAVDEAVELASGLHAALSAVLLGTPDAVTTAVVVALSANICSSRTSPASERQSSRCAHDGPRGQALTRAGPPGPAPLRHNRCDRLLAGIGSVGVPARTGLRSCGPPRRDEPHAAADSVCPARGHGGAAGLRRRGVVAVAPAPSGGGDPESGRTARHLPARREPARPLRSLDLDRVPRRRGRDAARPPQRRSLRARRARLPVSDPARWQRAINATASVQVVTPVAEYAVSLVRATWTAGTVRLGASPRAAISLIRSAQAHAVLRGRPYVTPQDVQEVAVLPLPPTDRRRWERRRTGPRRPNRRRGARRREFPRPRPALRGGQTVGSGDVSTRSPGSRRWPAACS